MPAIGFVKPFLYHHHHHPRHHPGSTFVALNSSPAWALNLVYHAFFPPYSGPTSDEIPASSAFCSSHHRGARAFRCDMYPASMPMPMHYGCHSAISPMFPSHHIYGDGIPGEAQTNTTRKV
ncbi:hypothetical protein RB213_007261 [Colletotrichum asianum]